MKKCLGCLLTKDLSEFSKKSNAKDGKQSRCVECQRKKTREHYANNKQYYVDKARNRNKETTDKTREYILQYYRDNPCIDCSEEDIRCLQFDHVRGEKYMNIADMVRRFSPLEKVKKEIEKCEVRCANCHLKRTAEQFGWWTHALVYPLATDELKG